MSFCKTKVYIVTKEAKSISQMSTVERFRFTEVNVPLEMIKVCNKILLFLDSYFKPHYFRYLHSTIIRYKRQFACLTEMVLQRGVMRVFQDHSGISNSEV